MQLDFNCGLAQSDQNSDQNDTVSNEIKDETDSED